MEVSISSLLLVELMKIHYKDWKTISNIMGDRTGKQIRERFINKLDPSISKKEWTIYEDEIVI